MQKEMEKKNYVRRGRLLCLSLVAVGILIYGGKTVASAVASNSNTQVTVKYYSTDPSSATPYLDNTVDSLDELEEVTFTTKSKGRLQWGDPDANGNYSVYYDAKDVHTLAAELNESAAAYNELYETYVDTYATIVK